MILNFIENTHMGSIRLIPETPKEMAQLIRLCKNAKKQPVEMYFSFDGNDPDLHIWINKKNIMNQKNSFKAGE